MTAQIEGLVVSILIFGAALGAIVGGKLADIRGRNWFHGAVSAVG